MVRRARRSAPRNTLLSDARRRLSSPTGSGRSLSRQELAEAVNDYLWRTHRRRTSLDGNYIGKLERGEYRWPHAMYREAFRAVLGVSRDADLGFFITRGLHADDGARDAETTGTAAPGNGSGHPIGESSAVDSTRGAKITETDDMDRRELLRLLSMAGAALAVPTEGQLDWDRIASFARGGHDPESSTVDELAMVNRQLWRAFAAAETKAALSPVVNRQLHALLEGLRRAPGAAVHRRLCAVAADLFQLAGEIAFDGNRYTTAAHCYTLAATAGREADAFDLWACALTRHAFISVYERDFRSALPLLELAAALARRGDGGLSTRHWVEAVRAQALAGLGELDGCRRALDAAEEVHRLTGQVHNGGWLRFDGSRLAEERGTCYVELRRPDLAEPVLADALARELSVRRRGGVLTDLAMVGVQRGDPHEVVFYGGAAVDTVRQSRSGVVGAKLRGLQRHLALFAADSHVRHLDRQITTLAGPPAVP